MVDHDNSDISNFLNGYANVADYIEDGKKSVVNGIRTSNCFPTGLARDKFDTYPSFSRVVQSLDEFITGISDKLMKLENGVRNIYIPDEDQRFNALEEVNDQILERCNFKTDSIAGHTRRGPGLKEFKSLLNNVNKSQVPLRCEITKPQLKFREVIDNSHGVWKPIIADKPNSSCELHIKEIYDENDICIGYEHPYRNEIDSFDPYNFMCNTKKGKLIVESLQNTPLIFVDTKEKFNSLLKDLESVSEIAIDLEHNDRRSFQGITCLMQISTHVSDYIIDVFVLWESIHLLNQSFTNPNILKVLHGANSDILWLQRDFGVYIVGMFDTYQASQKLNLNQKSLAALIKRYCNITVDKKHQRADWRIRPLPADMVEYARIDTHYLLYIWRKLHAELLSLGRGTHEKILSVFEASKQVCLRTYEKRQLREDSYQELLFKTYGKSFNHKQTLALKHLYEWRDAVARKEDEGIDFVLPSHMILSLAEVLPKEKEGILEMCQPKPALLLQYLQEIYAIILFCRDASMKYEISMPVNDDSRSIPKVENHENNNADIYAKLCRKDLQSVSNIRAPKKWDDLIKIDLSGNFKNIEQESFNTFKDFPVQLRFT